MPLIRMDTLGTNGLLDEDINGLFDEDFEDEDWRSIVVCEVCAVRVVCRERSDDREVERKLKKIKIN